VTRLRKEIEPVGVVHEYNDSLNVEVRTNELCNEQVSTTGLRRNDDCRGVPHLGF
jgi:hypothetical protein